MRSYVTLIFLILFVSFGSYFFFDEFQDFQLEKEQSEKSASLVQKEIWSFSHEDIETLPWIHLYSLPDPRFLDDLVSKIDTSKEKIWLNVYIFTEKRIRSALIKAKKRGVDVRVILEKNVYQAPSINKETFLEFEKNSILIKYDNTSSIDLNHAKYLIIDNEAIFSTGNFTYTSFSKNREFFLISQNQSLVRFLKNIFESDFNGKKEYFYHPNMLVSPRYSREKIQYFLNSSKKNIDMYIPYLEDESIKNILLKKQSQGINIRIITSPSEKEDAFLLDIQKKWAHITFSKKTIHAKSFLIDNNYLYIGSINFSASSMDQNREIGIILKEKEIISQFQKVFKSDL